jgi:outer membrane protein TolC
VAADRDFLARVDQVLGVVDTMERAGEIARTEARLFRIEKATKVSELALLEADATHADLRLRQLMGLSSDAPLRLQAMGGGPLRASMHEASASELQSRSPALLTAQAEYHAAEKALELEIRKQYPDLRVSPGYGREDGQDQLLLGLSLPLPLLNANRRGIAEADARRDLARATAETTLERVTSDIRAARVRLDAVAQRRTTLETDIVPLVDAQYADAREVARLGEVNTLVLLESLKRQHEAKLALVTAVRDEAIAAIDLEELLGPIAERTPESPAAILPRNHHTSTP